MISLDAAFLTIPLAHRGLHDISDGRPENSRASVMAALEAGYGIEIDLQMSADNVPMVFHDDYLGRLTGREGKVRDFSRAELQKTPLLHGSETIPTFAEILELVAGKAPLLVEIKDQDGGLEADTKGCEEPVAALANSYGGPIGLMSFNPHSMFRFQALCPELPRGLVTERFSRVSWPFVSPVRREELSSIPDYDKADCSFISHGLEDLDQPQVAEIKRGGGAVLCWTVKSPAQEIQARKVADNITFEKYLPALSAKPE